MSIYENGKQKKYRDGRDNIYYFNAQNELINYTDKTGKNLFTFNIKGKLIFEKGQAFVCIVKIEQEYTNCNRIQLTDITDENLITQTEVPIYGSDRIGTYNPPSETNINSDIYILNRSYKRYELKDHLGNVRVTVSDSKRVSFVSETLVFSADIKTYTDYYVFGMEMVGRNWSESEAYRQGYNGKENDKDFGEGVQDYGARLSDNQVARWFSLDPLMSKNAEKTPYNYIGNNPILYVDPDGKDNIIYLAFVGDGRSEQQLMGIRDIANANFIKLGLNTRVSILSPKEVKNLNYKDLDETDGLVIMGNDNNKMAEYLKQVLYIPFGLDKIIGSNRDHYLNNLLYAVSDDLGNSQPETSSVVEYGLDRECKRKVNIGAIREDATLYKVSEGSFGITKSKNESFSYLITHIVGHNSQKRGEGHYGGPMATIDWNEKEKKPSTICIEPNSYLSDYIPNITKKPEFVNRYSFTINFNFTEQTKRYEEGLKYRQNVIGRFGNNEARRNLQQK